MREADGSSNRFTDKTAELMSADGIDPLKPHELSDSTRTGGQRRR